MILSKSITQPSLFGDRIEPEFHRPCCEHVAANLLTRAAAVSFEDAEHGITPRLWCKACYAAHILKYYPDGRMANYIRSHPDDYKITE